MAAYLGPRLPRIWLTIASCFLVEMYLWVAYDQRWYDREAIQFFATVVGGCFALYVYLRSVEDTRNQESGRFVERWNSPEFRDIVNRTRPFVDDPSLSRALAPPGFSMTSASDEQKARRGDILTILAFFEELAIAVARGHAAEPPLQDFFSSVIPRGYEGFEEFVLGIRQERKDIGFYRPTQLLVERWTGGKRRELP